MEAIDIAWRPVVAVAALMLLDIAFGFAGAVKSGEVSSGKMRDGLWHKAGFCGLIVVAAVYEIAAVWIDFEAASAGLGIGLPQIPTVGIVCAYIFITEIVSILENLRVLNPGIARFGFVARLKSHDPGAADLTVEIEDEELATGRSE